MKKRILSLIIAVAFCHMASTQTYEYLYTVKADGSTMYQSYRNKDVKVSFSSDKNTCTDITDKKTYKYKGVYGDYRVYEYTTNMGFRNGSYTHNAFWIMFSSSYTEMAIGKNECTRAEGMDVINGHNDLYDQMKSNMGFSTNKNDVEIWQVYKVNPLPEMKRKYDYVTAISGTSAYFIGKNNKFGIADAVGNVIVSPRYDNISSEGSVYMVSQKGKKGLMNSSFYEVLSPRYDDIVKSGSNYIVTLKGKKGLLSSSYNEVLSPKYDNITTLGNGYLVTQNGKKGYYNSLYREVIPTRYSSIQNDGSDGFFVNDGNKKGYINSSGTVIIAPIECFTLRREAGGFVVVTNEGEGYISSNGTMIIAPNRYSRIVSDKGKGFKVYKGKFCGYCDASGHELMQPNKYTDVSRNDHGFYVKVNEQMGYCDASGREIVPPNYSSVTRDIYDGYYVKINYGGTGYYNKNGQLIISPNYTAIERDGYSGFFVTLRDTKGYLSLSGNTIIPTGKYNTIKRDEDNGFYVGANNTAGYLASDGTVLIPTGQYSSVFRNHDGSFNLKQNKNLGYADSKGNVIVPAKYNSVKKVGNRYKITNNGREGWYNSKGRLVLPPWQYIYMEGTYGISLSDEPSHFVGLQYTNVRRMIGYNIALTGGLTDQSLSLMAGPTLRLNKSEKSLQLFANAGFTYSFDAKSPFSLAAGGGLLFGFGVGDIERFDLFSITLGAQYLNSQLVPTIGIGIIPVGYGFAAVGRGIGSAASGLWEWLSDKSSFPSHFSEFLIGAGTDYFFGINYTFLRNRLGIYGSFMCGLSDGIPAFFVGPAFRLTDSYYQSLDFQVYQGFGMLGDGFGGETGCRFGFTKYEQFCKLSLSVGVIYGADHVAALFGFSWPIVSYLY